MTFAPLWHRHLIWLYLIPQSTARIVISPLALKTTGSYNRIKFKECRSKNLISSLTEVHFVTKMVTMNLNLNFQSKNHFDYHNQEILYVDPSSAANNFKVNTHPLWMLKAEVNWTSKNCIWHTEDKKNTCDSVLANCPLDQFIFFLLTKKFKDLILSLKNLSISTSNFKWVLKHQNGCKIQHAVIFAPCYSCSFFLQKLCHLYLSKQSLISVHKK